MDQRLPLPEARREAAPSPVMSKGRSAIRLVAERKLMLDLAGADAPAEWRKALDALATAHRLALDLAARPVPRAGGLRQVARWAAGAGQAPAAPVFAPWQGFASASLQNPLMRPALPQAQWLAGYLFDPDAARSTMAAGSVDVMLVSPHPAACLEDNTCHTALPRKAVLDAMIGAVRAEQRERLAIIVPARARSAVAQRLLLADRALRQGDMAIEIIAIEEAIGRLVRCVDSWDAIIALPELRGIIAAVFAEVSGIAGPWPLLWFDGGLVRVSSEVLRETAQALPLDAAVLMQGLALAARCGGHGEEAQRLAHSWCRLRASGVGTASRRSSSPYGKQLDDSAFVMLASADQPISGGRPLPAWRALRLAEGNQAVLSAVPLALVKA
ncbi:MAG: hypothetical protein ACK4IS_06445 [Erythrobacter sp.]